MWCPHPRCPVRKARWTVLYDDRELCGRRWHIAETPSTQMQCRTHARDEAERRNRQEKEKRI